MLSHLLGSAKDGKPSKEEESLTTILESHQDRSELTLLIANCTESIRRVIVDAFDPEQVGKVSDITAKLTSEAGPTKLQQSASTEHVTTEQTAAEHAEALEKQQKELEKRRKELSEAKMQELKVAALTFFDSWRDDVLARVGQVLNAKEEETKKQTVDAHAPAPHAEEKKISSTSPEKQDEGAGEALRELYPPIKTPLTALPVEKRALILHSLLLLSLSLEHYCAYSRVLMLHLTSSLQLPLRLLTEDEVKLATTLLKVADMSADDETKKRAEQNHDSRKWKVGFAAVAGAALIGITGGLAAPLVAAGIGTVIEGIGLGATAAAGYLGTLASSSLVVGGLFGAYGGKMTGEMMDSYAKEVEDFAFVPIRVYHRPHKTEDIRRLRIAIGISGWLTEKEEVLKPWRLLKTSSIEAFALRWELESLLSLGNALTEFMSSAAWGAIKKEIIKRTVFATLFAAIWPLKLLRVSKVIDNPFSVGLVRSEKAGQVLADALINKAQGERPVTLIGYSLGARVIYSCLLSLAERKAFGLVESAVLLGAPVPSAAGDWRKMRTVVSGRLVNVHSSNDYILAFLYRTSSIQYGVAGLQSIDGVAGVQNVDVSDLVSGHTKYRYLTGSILKKIGFEDVDVVEVDKEEAELEALEAMEEKERRKKEEEKEKHHKTDEEEAKDMEKEITRKTEQSHADWLAEKLKLTSLKEAWGDGKKGSEAKAPA